MCHSDSLLGKSRTASCVSRPGNGQCTIILLSQVHAYTMWFHILTIGIHPALLGHHVVRSVQYCLVLLFNLLYHLFAQGRPVSEEVPPVCSHHARIEVEVDISVL